MRSRLELELTLADVRRLAVAAQRLNGPVPLADAEGLMDVIRDLGCLQLDPIHVVARSHLLVLAARLGAFDPAVLDRLLWDERRLFEYWAHDASIVLTEDLAIHRVRMRRYPGESPWAGRIGEWMEANNRLRRHILTMLRSRGPQRAEAFTDLTEVMWQSSGWTKGRNVERMLTFLWAQGKVLVAGREGQARVWDLADRVLPAWAPRRSLPEPQMVRVAADRALRALGAGTPAHIEQHFVRWRYPGLPSVLDHLVRSGRAVRALVVDDPKPGTRGRQWYVHADRLEVLEGALGEPRAVLLSPFDNLICDRKRTEDLWGFRYRSEIYVPKDKRVYGYYVMPVLWGDRLIGRVDPWFDRAKNRLVIRGVHAEPGTAAAGAAVVVEAVSGLAAFLRADDVAWDGPVPRAWRRALGGARRRGS